ncbi:MAG: LIC_12616 family protein [Bradymonadaceae bacterium]
MTESHEAFLQDIRAWVMLASSIPSTHVIPSDDTGVRPSLPYVTVGLTTYDVEVGTDEEIYEDDDGDLMVKAIGDRRATLSINAYGGQGADILALCHLSLSQPVVQRFLLEKSLGIQAMGGTQDLSALVDTRREKRFLKEFEITYAVELGQAEPETHFEELGMGIDLDSDPDFNDPINVTVEVD